RRCFQRLITSAHSYPAMPETGQQVHQRCVHSGPLVLGAALRNIPTPTADSDRTVSRRSEPSSRTALNVEQPYPSDLLQPQAATTRVISYGEQPCATCQRPQQIGTELSHDVLNSALVPL